MNKPLKGANGKLDDNQTCLDVSLTTAPLMIKPKEEPVNGKRPEAPQTTESLIRQVTTDTPVKEAEGLLSNTGSSKKLDKKQVQTKKGQKKSSEKSAEEKT